MPSVMAGDLRRRIQSLLGDPSGTYITQEDTWDWIGDAQHQISKITECLTSDLAPINAVANQERYLLTDTLLKVLRVTYDNVRLYPTTIELLDELDPNRDVPGNNGVPSNYYLDGAHIGIWRKPSSNLTNAIRIRARILADGNITNDGDVLQIPDYFREDVVRYATLKGREKDESPEFIAVLMQDWEQKISTSKGITDNPEASTYPSIRDSETLFDYVDVDPMY